MDWKEINAAIQEKLRAATEGKEGDDRESALSSELRNLDQAIRQPIYDSGHGAALRQNTERVKDLEKQLADQKASAESASNRVKELESKTPDLESIRKQHADQIADLQKEHKTVLDRLTTERKAEKIDAFRTRLTAAAGTRLDPAYAELQILKMASRIDTADTPIGIVVRQPGKDLPYLADDLDSLVNTVVKELVDTAPADRRISAGDKGGGADSGNRGSDSGDVWDKARNRGKEIAKPGSSLSDEAAAKRLSSL